jgi:SAM-dependent methyltransferase
MQSEMMKIATVNIFAFGRACNTRARRVDRHSLPMDVISYNRQAWARLVQRGNRWTVPVGSDIIAAARRGEWEIVLTPRKPVPREWLPDISGRHVLCLASAGGQQAPVLAAAGATVTVLDNSPEQLTQDRMVVERDGLTIRLEEGDMRDLARFDDDAFDIIVHPCSNCFIPEVRPVWREAFRVLAVGGTLLSGFCNPVPFIFDQDLAEKGILQARYSVPYSDTESLSDEERRRFIDALEPLVFGHTLEAQIGGQLEAGFIITGFYEDYHDDSETLARYLPGFAATRALKPK